MELQERNSHQRRSPSDGKSMGQFDSKVQEPQRIHKLGEKGTGIIQQGRVQDYDCLKEECLSTGKLFEDPEFPAVDSSIFISERPTNRFSNEIKWIRPPAFRANAQFYVEGASRFDVKPGRFGNYWMVAAVANVAMRKDLLDKVIPPGQSFQENYAGIFRFRFWQYGKWVEVVIDDRLPTYNGELIGMHSIKENEFWSALLEKAYAKLHDCWEVLEKGWNGEALTDLTGGIVQYWLIKKAPLDLFDILLEAQERKSLFSTGIPKDQTSAREIDEWKEKLGLNSNHAYSIRKVMYLDGEVVGQTDKIPLLRLSNPCGEEEWTGAWSESSTEWASIPKCKKKELDLVCTEDGEFWISLEDWKKNFTHCEICYLTPSSVTAKDTSTDEKNWEANEVVGEWVAGSSAGGNRYFEDTFQYNPQYRIEFKEDSTAIVALMQLNLRTERTGPQDMNFGFLMYKLPEEFNSELPKPLNASFLKKNEPFIINELIENEMLVPHSSSDYQRQCSCRIRLKAGAYCIIPYAMMKNEEAQFLLRVFSEVPNNLEVYDVQVDRSQIYSKVLENSNYECKDVLNIFEKNSGNDQGIGWRKLKKLLDSKLDKELPNKDFGEDACRRLFALFDADYAGTLGYYEFKELWKNLQICKAVYHLEYHKPAGYLEPYILKEVLRSAGFRINNQVSDLLKRRYGMKDGSIKFVDFIIIVSKLDKVLDTLEKHATAGTKTTTFTDDERINSILSI